MAVDILLVDIKNSWLQKQGILLVNDLSGDRFHCPLERALRRNGYPEAVVNSRTWLPFGDPFWSAPLEFDARFFVARYDAGMEVAAMTVHVRRHAS